MMSVLLLLQILGVFIAWKFIYALFLNPLRKLPGPFFPRVTSKWLSVVDLSFKRTATIHQLHQKHGPVVQIGPHEVSFNDVSVIDQVYGNKSDFPKASWYSYMTRGGVFNETNIDVHRSRRKLMSHAFSQQVVNDMESTIHTQLRRMIRFVEDRRESKPIDVRHMMRMVSFDMATAVFFGKEEEGAGGLNHDEPPQYIRDLDNAFLVWELDRRFPYLLWLAGFLPSKAIRHFSNSADRIYGYGRTAFADYLNRFGRKSGRKDFLAKLIREDPKDDKTGLSDAECASEVTNLTFAATDTTAVVLFYILWELSQNQELQNTLREELREATAGEDLPYHQAILPLPMLNAVIQEGLRKHMPTPMGLLRTVPAGGRKMAGYYIPENTWVSVSAWESQMTADTFPEPTKFDPTRWLDPPGGTEAMKARHMPFSKGLRNCIGQSMALFELRLVIAVLVGRYTMTLNKDMKPSDMDFGDMFVMIPHREDCLVDFTPVQN